MSAKKTVVFGILLAIVAVWSAVYINGRMAFLEKQRQAEIERAEEKRKSDELTKQVEKVLGKDRAK